LQLQDVAVKAREDAAAFDTSRLVEFSERLVWEGPAVQLSPLVREPGRLAVTDQRLYFQPLHNIAGAWLCEDADQGGGLEGGGPATLSQ
jgi:factor associated with neutral sphingomyelinase activation